MTGSARPLRSAIVTVGEELLLGRTVDTNAAWLGERLAELGVPVSERSTVGDDDVAIRRAVGEALGRTELVVVTGGLGPTDDDRTRPAVAALLDAPLELDEGLLAALERRFLDRGFDALPPSNRGQAMVPRGGTALPNPAGTAPGLVLDTPDGRVVVLLPGPPRELRALFPAAANILRGRFGQRLRPVAVRTVHTTGISESVLAPQVEEALGAVRDVEVAFLPDLAGVDIRFTVRDQDADEAEGRLERAVAAVAPVVERYRFEAGPSGDLAEAVFRALDRRGLTLATAESCTAGIVAMRLTEWPGSSRVFRGGVVAYDDAVKREVLGVDAAVLVEQGAVSEAVARAMAEGVRRRLGTDAGLGVTGIAGPEGGSEAKPVGTVWYAVSLGDRVEARHAIIPGDRAGVRWRSGQAVLALLLAMVEGRR